MKKINRILVSAVTSVMLVLPILTSPFCGLAEEQVSKRMQTVIQFAEDAIKYTQFSVPGSLYPSLLVNGYNVDTKKPMEWVYKGETYYPSNITNQQNFFRILVGLTNLTGNPKYRAVAEEQVRLWFNGDFADSNGLLYAGEHSFVDVKTGKILSYNEHEMKQVFPYYEFMYEVEPEGLKRYMEACWNSHITDWSALGMNRHGYYEKPMSDMWDSEYTDDSIDFNNGQNLAFQNAGDDLINFAFFIAEKTGEEGPEIWARRMLQKYMDTAHPVTGLSGAQYGEQDTGDRYYLQYGPEFGSIAKEYNNINRYKINTIAGWVPQYLIPYAKRTGDTAVKDYIINSVRGTAKYVYDVKKHNLHLPMWSDGTYFGGFVRQRSGYAGVKGSVVPTGGEKIFPIVLLGTVKTYEAYGGDDIWEFARNMAKGFELGDIGTAPGENVSVNLDTKASDPDLVFAMLSLYESTGVEDYLAVAEKMGETIIDEYNVLASGKSDTAYISIDHMPMVALLRIEAAARGDFDAVDRGAMAEGGIEFDVDGLGRSSMNAAFFDRKRKAAESVTINESQEILLTTHIPEYRGFDDIHRHWAEEDIRRLVPLANVSGVSEGVFAPDNNITRAEFTTLITRLCNFKKRAKTFKIYDDVADGTWYRDAIEMARNNELIDDNLVVNGCFNPNTPITIEEMTSIAVRALIKINKDTKYVGNGASNKLDNVSMVSEWAKEYVDIACNYDILNNRQATPKAYATRAEAAAMLMRLNDIIGKDFKYVTADIKPDDSTTRYVKWSSSDVNVFDVDENGRLYPISEGTATLIAEADGIMDTRTVKVEPREDWMLKYIKLNGENMSDFASVTKDYNVDMLLGNKLIPSIEAEAYTGEKVWIKADKNVPGSAELRVGESENKYTLNFTANRINYLMEDDLNGYVVGKGLHNIYAGKSLWYFNSASWESGHASVRIQNKPNITNGDKCLVLPYHSDVAVQVRGRFPDTPYIIGEDADDNYIVFEFDLMASSPIEDLNVYIRSDTKNPIRLKYFRKSISTVSGSSFVDLGTYTPGKFDSFKIVVNKKTMLSDWYFNGKKILTKQEPANTKEFSCLNEFMFTITNSAVAEMGTKVYVDNVKMYELPGEYLEMVTQ